MGDFGFSQTPQRYDPATNTWLSAGRLPVGFVAGGQTATALPDGRVLVIALVGDASAAQIYDPALNR